MHSSVPSFSNCDELEEELAVARDPELRPDAERGLRLGEEASLPGLYCLECGVCVPQCTMGAAVPTLMRAYLYAAGQGRPEHARYVLRGWYAGDIPRTRCAACRVRCALGFDVRERALAVAQVLDIGPAVR